MTYDHWKSTETRDVGGDELGEYEGEEECEHEWCTLKDLFGEPYGVCMKCGYENDE